jgi:hypothetical protein
MTEGEEVAMRVVERTKRVIAGIVVAMTEWDGVVAMRVVAGTERVVALSASLFLLVIAGVSRNPHSHDRPTMCGGLRLRLRLRVKPAMTARNDGGVAAMTEDVVAMRVVVQVFPFGIKIIYQAVFPFPFPVF